MTTATTTQNWERVQRTRVGASPQTCKMGGANYRYDNRPYGTALEEEEFPLIRQWTNRQWTEESRKEFLRFLRRAIAHGSFPMLAVAALAANQQSWVIKSLSDSEVGRLYRLVRIGSAQPEWKDVIGLLLPPSPSPEN